MVLLSLIQDGLSETSSSPKDAWRLLSGETKEVFETYLEHFLTPVLRPGRWLSWTTSGLTRAKGSGI